MSNRAARTVLLAAAAVAGLLPFSADADGTIGLLSDSYYTLETPWTPETGSRVVCEGSGVNCTVPAGRYTLVNQQARTRSSVLVADDGITVGRQPPFPPAGTPTGPAPAPAGLELVYPDPVQYAAPPADGNGYRAECPAGARVVSVMPFAARDAMGVGGIQNIEIYPASGGVQVYPESLDSIVTIHLVCATGQ